MRKIKGRMDNIINRLRLNKIDNCSNLQERKGLCIVLMSIMLICYGSQQLYVHLFNSGIPAEVPFQVQTIRAKQSPMPEVIETVGAMAAKDTLTLIAVSPGRVKELLVDSGSYVKKGALLANIIGAPEVKAAFDGYLTDWQINVSEYVLAGTKLIDLINTNILTLTYRVPEQYVGKLNISQSVEFSTKTSPDQIFHAKVRFIAPIIDKKTHTILVRAEVKNKDQNLWSGMSIRVRHILHTNPEALVIPEASLKLTMGGYSVFVIDKNGVIQKKTVQIGNRGNGRVHILYGLNPGDDVILTLNYLVMEGKKAVANNWAGDW